jgi:GDP-4-dehydro-6-deoxy-D-mannose reductase
VRALITGGSGFAGSWLCRECAEAGDEVVAISRRGSIAAGCGRGVALDMRDQKALAAVLREARPEVVYHLAALSSVGRSWQEPARTLGENVQSAVSLLEGVRQEAPDARVVWVSSCEVYGEPDSLPITEEAIVRPASPYAVSKASGELLAGVYAGSYGLKIIRARPFSHAGPGQLPIFLLSSLASQAAAGQLAGETHLQIVTGNPNTRRDFTDVRDVVRAYRLLAQDAAPGVYNVSSGESLSAADQVALLGELIAPMEIEHSIDPSRVRAHEVTDLRGDHSRLTAATGWNPEIPLRQTMAETIEWWRRELSDRDG